MLTSVAVADIEVWDDAEQSCRMRKKAIQQGHSEQRGELYYLPYLEPLSEARTPLADFFGILLGITHSKDIRSDTRDMDSRHLISQLLIPLTTESH